MKGGNKMWVVYALGAGIVIYFVSTVVDVCIMALRNWDKIEINTRKDNNDI